MVKSWFSFKVLSIGELYISSLKILSVRWELVRFKAGTKVFQLSWKNYGKAVFLLHLPIGARIPITFLASNKKLRHISPTWRCGSLEKPFVFELMWRNGDEIVRSRSQFQRKGKPILSASRVLRERNISHASEQHPE